MLTDTDKESPDKSDPSLVQSASFTDLSALSSADSSASPPLRRAFSDHHSPGNPDVPAKSSIALGKGILRRKSFRSKGKSAVIGASQLNVSTEDLVNGGWNAEQSHDNVAIPETKPPEPAARPAKGRSMSGRLASLARNWSSNAPSRSPSSLQSERNVRESNSQPPPSQADSASNAAVEGKRNVPYRRPRLPKLAVVADGGDGPVTPTSPASSLRPKRSFSKIPSAPNVSTPVLPPMPKSTPTSSIVSSDSPEVPRMKDELWGVFRNLDVEYQR